MSTSAKRPLRVERIIGLTSATNANTDTNLATGDVAYAAGCHVVVYSPKRNLQHAYVRTALRINCIRYSQDGQLLAVGELGELAAITVWDMKKHVKLADLHCHNGGVACCAFSQDNKFLVSVGVGSHPSLVVNDWRIKKQVTKVDLPNQVFTIACLSKTTFATGGESYIRFWSLAYDPVNNESVMLQEHAAGLTTDYSHASFVDIQAAPHTGTQQESGSNSPSCFAVTKCGALITFGEKFNMDKWVLLETKETFSLCVRPGQVTCACDQGVVRVFSSKNLEYITTLPSPLPKGTTDLNYTAKFDPNRSLTSFEPDKQYPAACCVQSDPTGKLITVIYKDHSIIVWDVSKPSKAVRLRTLVAHDGPVQNITNLKRTQGVSGPALTAVSCALDGTVRAWSLDGKRTKVAKANKLERGELYAQCLLDPECFAFQDPLVDKDTRSKYLVLGSDPNCPFVIVGGAKGFVTVVEVPSMLQLNRIQLDSKSCVTSTTCCMLSSFVVDNENLTESKLNIRNDNPLQELQNCNSQTLRSTTSKVTEDNNVSSQISQAASSKFPVTWSLVVVGTEDGDIHVFLGTHESCHSQTFRKIVSLDDHGGSKVVSSQLSTNSTRLVTSSEDGKLMIYDIEAKGSQATELKVIVQLITTIVTPVGSIRCMDIDVSNKFVATAGKAAQGISVWSLATGKLVRRYSIFESESLARKAGDTLRVKFDPSSLYVAVASQDCIVRLIDFYSGELVGKASGHSAPVSGISFVPDCKRFVSCSEDGCVLVWRLSMTIASEIRARISELQDEKLESSTIATTGGKGPIATQVHQGVLSTGSFVVDDSVEGKEFNVARALESTTSDDTEKHVSSTTLAQDRKQDNDDDCVGPVNLNGVLDSINHNQRNGHQTSNEIENTNVSGIENSAKDAHVPTTVKVEHDPPQETSTVGNVAFPKSKLPTWARTSSLQKLPAPGTHAEVALESTTTESSASNAQLTKVVDPSGTPEQVQQVAEGKLRSGNNQGKQQSMDMKQKQHDTEQSVKNMLANLQRMGIINQQAPSGSEAQQEQLEDLQHITVDATADAVDRTGAQVEDVTRSDPQEPIDQSQIHNLKYSNVSAGQTTEQSDDVKKDKQPIVTDQTLDKKRDATILNVSEKVSDVYEDDWEVADDDDSLSESIHDKFTKTDQSNASGATASTSSNPDTDVSSQHTNKAIDTDTVSAPVDGLCDGLKQTPVIPEPTRQAPPVEEESESSTLPLGEGSESITLPLKEESESTTLPLGEGSESITLPLKEESESTTLPLKEESESTTLPLKEESESTTLPLKEEEVSESTTEKVQVPSPDPDTPKSPTQIPQTPAKEYIMKQNVIPETPSTTSIVKENKPKPELNNLKQDLFAINTSPGKSELATQRMKTNDGKNLDVNGEVTNSEAANSILKVEGIQSVDEAKDLCNQSLNQLKAALRNTVKAFGQMKEFEQSLTEQMRMTSTLDVSIADSTSAGLNTMSIDELEEDELEQSLLDVSFVVADFQTQVKKNISQVFDAIIPGASETSASNAADCTVNMKGEPSSSTLIDRPITSSSLNADVNELGMSQVSVLTQHPVEVNMMLSKLTEVTELLSKLGSS